MTDAETQAWIDKHLAIAPSLTPTQSAVISQLLDALSRPLAPHRHDVIGTEVRAS